MTIEQHRRILRLMIGRMQRTEQMHEYKDKELTFDFEGVVEKLF